MVVNNIKCNSSEMLQESFYNYRMMKHGITIELWVYNYREPSK